MKSDERMGDLIALLEGPKLKMLPKRLHQGQPDAAAIANGPLDPIFPPELLSVAARGSDTMTISTEDMPHLSPEQDHGEEPASPMHRGSANLFAVLSILLTAALADALAAEEEPEAAPGLNRAQPTTRNATLWRISPPLLSGARRLLLHCATKAWSNLVLENDSGHVHKCAVFKLLPHPDDEDSYSKTCPAGHNYPPITEFEVRAGSHLWGESACFCLEFKSKHDRISRATGTSKPSLQWLGHPVATQSRPWTSGQGAQRVLRVPR